MLRWGGIELAIRRIEGRLAWGEILSRREFDLLPSLHLLGEFLLGIEEFLFRFLAAEEVDAILVSAAQFSFAFHQSALFQVDNDIHAAADRREAIRGGEELLFGGGGR